MLSIFFFEYHMYFNTIDVQTAITHGHEVTIKHLISFCLILFNLNLI